MIKSISKNDIKEIVDAAINRNNKVLINELKKELSRELLDIRNNISRNYLSIKILENKFVKLNDDIYLLKDEIIGEVKHMQDEFSILTGYRDMIEDHDVRIVKLENNVLKNKTS
ncbi:hypothetical protein A3A93_06150 [Candidatus Roizmanbacteria bacterium RIFCSPLOWO2_01_FULL_38_12]|uniref:Uncharacterized protein n=1 Tax=Candidatus Roizmanbacteria bacterium RIFCSPLOWO2_01_FULL_38_12 TaxID=1802061 RepID=A0A1F7ITW8_9BACT|nr:MAG: hypothetical protein A3A93_06150 [Candidatus Roizmanbacteria bacterium RIFCSPLOWO2_01_FULL_38_12]